MVDEIKKPFVYAISNGEHIKIGVAKKPSERLKNLSTGSAKKLIILGYFDGGFEHEKELHSKFKKVRENGEWFYPTQDLIDFLNNNLPDKFIIVKDDKILFYPKMKQI